MKVLLVDAHSLVREGIRHIIDRHFPGAIVFETSNFQSTRELAAREMEFDVVLLDFKLPDINGIDCIRKLKLLLPTTPIVSLSGVDDADTITTAIKAGVQGFIPKSSNADIMAGAINLVLSGGIYIPPELFDGNPATTVLSVESVEQNNSRNLTKRQQDVLKYLVDGKSNKEIANQLNLSEATVKSHLAGLFRSLNASNRTQAVKIALDRELLDI